MAHASGIDMIVPMKIDHVGKSYMRDGAERVWAYSINERNGYALKNAKAFRRLLQRSVERDHQSHKAK
jgi:hypothetical protein